MESALLVVVLITLFVRWLVLSGKMNSMQQKIELLTADTTQPMLIARVYALEQAMKELRATAGSPAREQGDMAPALDPVIFEPVVLESEVPRIWESVKLETTPPPLPKSEPEQVPVPSFSMTRSEERRVGKE